MFGVETNSFLPNDQGDGRNLARQGEARHRWLRASGHARLVEILERSAGSSRSRGRTFENIFQIVIMIFVQTPDGQEFLGTSELTTHEPVFPTGVSRQRQAAVGPQLPLGAKAMGCLHQRDQQSRSNGSNRGNLPQQFHHAVFLALCQ